MKKQRILKAFSILVMFVCIDFFPSCMPGNPSEEEFSQIGVSGALLSSGPAPSPMRSKSGEAAGTALAGYQLYCVTTTEPWVEGSGFADAFGKVALVLRVKSASFACSVLDPSGTTVASITFSDASGTNQGRIISANADVNLGTISVDLDAGDAQVTIPPNVIIIASNSPTTRITSGPSNPTASQTATFQFSCDQAGCTFKCKLDSGDWEACASPKTYTNLSKTSHIFQVMAENLSGIVDPTPASYSWLIKAHDYWVENTILRNLPDPRSGHTAVWTGTEMIVWGGYNGLNYFNNGARYNPATDSWAATTTINAPVARRSHTSVWTGTEMIVFGGSSNGNILWDPTGKGSCNSEMDWFNTGGRYNPSTDSWKGISTSNAPSARITSSIWTGTEMIVWGGLYCDGSVTYLNTGGRYNPSADSWAATSITNAPLARESHTMVWTGTEMIVWGGEYYESSLHHLNTGGRYNPLTDSWSATTTINAPSERSTLPSVWTGTEMIVWGGNLSKYTGGRYNPATDSWTATTTANAPSGRESHTAIWTGTEMIVWGGSPSTSTGGKYNPGTDSWTATTTTGAPEDRMKSTAVWTGTEMIVWGGYDGTLYFNTGGRYKPSTDSWTATSTNNAPSARQYHPAIWTGTEMIVWGGMTWDGSFALNTGGRYNPSTDSWVATTTTNAPSGRHDHSIVWTGTEMIVWGGKDGVSHFNTGGRYNPSTNSWIATTTTNAPSEREAHSAVWTETEMIVWGGDGGFGPLGTGGRYNPATDSWTTTTTTNAPSARTDATAVWTGAEMIVWGAYIFTNTGGRYNPETDSWIATSLTNAPSARRDHTAVWTGTEMIIWGGLDASTRFNTGGRYNPSTDSWIATTTINAPSARQNHPAAWTGTEMIIWGGNDGVSHLNTGGRYEPSTDSWTAITAINAPAKRDDNIAVWTGTELIIWGGSDEPIYFNSGGRYVP